jgi:hypothetical protein
VVLGVDPGTGIEAKYVEHIARQPSEVPRLELSVRIGRLVRCYFAPVNPCWLQ